MGRKKSLSRAGRHCRGKCQSPFSYPSFPSGETRAAISHFPRAYFTVERAMRQWRIDHDRRIRSNPSRRPRLFSSLFFFFFSNRGLILSTSRSRARDDKSDVGPYDTFTGMCSINLSATKVLRDRACGRG